MWRLVGRWFWLVPLGLVLVGFESPTVEQRKRAVGSLVGLDPVMRRAFSGEGAFEEKVKPKPADWLASHDEEGQGFAKYVGSRPNLPGEGRRKLYILPLGEFDDGKSPSLDKLRRYTAAYYHPLEVELLAPVPEKGVRAKSRLNRYSAKRQWNTRDILGWMPEKLPADAYAMLAVTMTDLYPDEAWNFVFGQASIKRRVGVFSFARYHPSWTKREPDEHTETLVLRRAAKVLTHEMGHMFGIRHCIYYECNMNGANHLQEADATPMHLCPVCLRKLQHATRFDPVGRYEMLSRFYGANGLGEEAGWVTRRKRAIGEVRGGG